MSVRDDMIRKGDARADSLVPCGHYTECDGCKEPIEPQDDIGIVQGDILCAQCFEESTEPEYGVVGPLE